MLSFCWQQELNNLLSMKEKDDLTALFQSLGDAKMQVKEGFWEGLEKDLSAVIIQTEDVEPAKRVVMRPQYRKWVAAASVLLIVAAGSFTFWSLNSQEQQIQQAFNEIVANVDAVNVEDVTDSSTPIIYNNGKQSIASAQRINNRGQRSTLSGLIPASLNSSEVTEVDDDDEMVPVEVTFQIIEHGYIKGGNSSNGLLNVSNGNLADSEGDAATTTISDGKNSKWALKPAVGTALPKGEFNMPLIAGMMLERKINKTLAVEAGLLYNYLPVHNDENQSSISLPVKLDVNLAESKKVDLYATVGGVAEKLLGKSFSEEPVQLAATAGLGVRYKVNDNLAIYAEPSLSHYFDTDGNTRTLRTEQAVNVNLLCGVRMSY